MTGKYELSDETKTLDDGVVVYRIRALVDFGDVKAGDLGGWVESERNLSQETKFDQKCWIYDDAMAIGCSRVMHHAKLRDRSRLLGFAVASSDTELMGDEFVGGRFLVQDTIGVEIDGVCKVGTRID